MRKRTQELIGFFRKNGGVARFSDILRRGFHPDSLDILIREKRVEKIARGIYRLSDYVFGEYPDLVIVSFQAPRGVICLLSSLYFHEATGEIPNHVDIAVPKGSHSYKIQYPPVKFYRFDSKSWKAGIEEHKIDGCKIRVYNLAKTIADCFKFRNKIGMDVAREALKVSVNEKGVKPSDIMEYAKVCRVDGIIKPILEMIL